VVVTHAAESAPAMEAALRRSTPPVIARIERDRLLLDLRTVFPEQEEDIVRACAQLANNPEV
jgi:L-seryl-tRNA(Ser) seleniumtransferase